MNKIAKISIAAGAVVIAVATSVFAISLTKNNKAVPTVSVLDISDLPQPEKTEEVKNWWEADEYSVRPEGLSERSKEYLSKNSDVVGWIRLDKTKINYPIVLDPGEILGEIESPDEETEDSSSEDAVSEETKYEVISNPNTYYLDKDLDGSHYESGTLFLDYRNRFGEVEEEQSDNIVIYGHNMMNNTAFGSLRKYRQDYSFYDESPIIELSSNYRDYQYIIFGYIITSGSYDATDFHYWNMEDFANEEEFNFYVDRITSKSMVDTGVDVKYGDKLLTLSTCYASEDNSRFIVVARRLRDHETSIDTIDRTEAYLEKIRQEEASRAAAEAEAASQEAEAQDSIQE